VTATLFLTDELTALLRPGEGPALGPAMVGRRGVLKADAARILGELGEGGEVVACLPPSWISCQVLRVRATIGRRVTHTDVSDALEAALKRSGAKDMAVVCGEPAQIFLDGEAVRGSPVGQSGQLLEVEVAALLTSLDKLNALEKMTAEAGYDLKGVMAAEEAAAAAVTPNEGQRSNLCILDRWHSKLIGFQGEALAISTTVAIGAGHLTSDVAVTFNLDDAKAATRVDKALLGRLAENEGETDHVVSARLDEIASLIGEAARTAGLAETPSLLVGLPVTKKVQTVFAAQGLAVRGPKLEIKKTDPPFLAFAEAAGGLASGAVPRTAATALQLSAASQRSTIWDWLKRNF
jgi:hypothetical protein